MNTKNNLRYKQSSEKIEKSFLKLIQDNKYEDISISQVCKESGINRSTFYSHYDDINDLVIKIESKFAKSMAKIFHYGERQTNEAFIEMFRFIRENKYFYKAFLNIPYATLAETNTKVDVLKHIGENTNIDKSNKMGIFYRASFFGAGIKEMCRLWLKYDCRETPEQMTKLLIDEYRDRNDIEKIKTK